MQTRAEYFGTKLLVISKMGCEVKMSSGFGYLTAQSFVFGLLHPQFSVAGGWFNLLLISTMNKGST